MATIYLDLEGGNDANTGASFAQRKKTLAGASAIAVAGDTVRVMASSTPNSLGTNGTFARGSMTITLAGAQNATLDQGEVAWTASANVTCTTATARKQGATSSSIAIASGFGTGKAAYVALGGTVDLSGYQQVSFWVQQTTGNLTANVSIRICTDAIGAVSVNTFTIPARAVVNGWHRVTIDLGSGMSAVAQSIALYVDSDLDAQTFLIDNIVACKAPGTGELSHKTLIGKANSLGAGGDDSETWYAIRAIEGTLVTLDLLNSSNAGSTTNGRYWGVSETVTAYSLFPSYVPVTVATADVLWTATGVEGSVLTISGGWNRTDMTTQTGHTWFSLGNAPATTVSVIFNFHYVAVSKLHFFGLLTSFSMTVNESTFTSLHAVNTASGTIQGSNNVISGLVFSNFTTSQPSVLGMGNTVDVALFGDQVGINFSTLCNSEVVLNTDSLVVGITFGANNLVTVGSDVFGVPSVAAIGADEGDTGVTLNKLKEMAAAFVAGKVSVSSAGGVSTYTYKKRDGTTTSFTSLCSETDGTRATTGSLS